MANIKLIAGPAFGLFIFLLMQSQEISYSICATALVTCWMAVWWITEAVDLGVTSFLPFILFPLLGIMDAGETAMQYMEQTIFLFIGGFMLAYAMEKWNLHQRIAYKIILMVGVTPSRILLGIMITTFIISMWISNTATAVMLISAVLAIISHEHLYEKGGHKKIACAFLLALAYSATIGGMSTLVGTPTNMIFAGFYEKMFPDGDLVSFTRWFAFSFPFALTFLAITFLVLKKLFIKKEYNRPFDISHIRNELGKLGPLQFEERIIMMVFSVAVVLWFTRVDIDFGSFKIKGWTTLFENGKFIKDSTVAVMCASILFFIPSEKNNGERILEWKDITKLPLRIILLFGSGFALAEGFEKSGLANFIAGKMIVFTEMPLWLIIMGIALLVTVLSEFASNVASVQLMLPIVAPLSVALTIDPLVLMVPVTLAASFGYMLPVATAANTIVYGTGYIPVRQMMRVGFLLNVIGIVLLTLFMTFWKF